MTGAEVFSVPGWSLPALFWTGVQASLLVLLAAVGAFALREGPAAGRHAVWTVALGGILLLPVLPSVLPFQVSAPVSPERVLSGALASLAPGGGLDRGAPAAAPAEDGPGETAIAPGSGPAAADGLAEAAVVPVDGAASVEDPASMPTGGFGSPAHAAASDEGVPPVPTAGTAPALGDDPARGGGRLPLLALMWLAGVGLMVGRFLLGGLILRRMIGRGTRSSSRIRRVADGIRASLGVRRPVRILIHDRVTSPMTWGMFRPAVLLPATAVDWDEDRLRVVFTHELAHIARLDVLTRAVAAVARAIHWFNPLVWWAAARMIAEAERACDDCVLRAGARPSDYADHLLALASGPVRRSMATAAASPMAQRSGFEGRILAILAAGPRGRFGGLAGLSLVCVGAATVLLVGSVVPGAAAVHEVS